MNDLIDIIKEMKSGREQLLREIKAISHSDKELEVLEDTVKNERAAIAKYDKILHHVSELLLRVKWLKEMLMNNGENKK